MRGNNIPNKGHIRELHPEGTHTSDFSKLDNLSDSFETYLENAPHAIYLIDLEGYLLYCNKKVEEITGFTKKELSGQNFFKIHLFSGEYSAKFTAILALSAAGKSPPSSEFELRRKDGTLTSVEVSTTPVEKEGKTVVIVFMRDVSERQHAEAQIISQSKFTSEDPNPVMRVNRECVILFHNKASLPLIRYWQTEIGKPLPKDWCRLVEAVYKNGISKTAEAKSDDKVYLLNVVPVKDNDYINIYGTEITDLKSAESWVQHLNRVLLTIRKVNQLIVVTDDEKELLQKTCEALVEGRNYSLARIGLTFAGSFDIRWAVQQSLGKDFPADIKVTWDDSEYGQGPVGMAIKTGKPVCIGDIATDESFRPWRDGAGKLGIASICALPLVVRNKTIGALGVYSDKKDAFSDDEIELLKELAGDVSLGIQKIRQQNEIRQNDEKYTTLVENSNDGIIILQNGKLKFASPQMDKMSGFSPEEYLDKPFINYIAPEYRESIIEMYKQRLIGKKVSRRYEIEIITKDNKSIAMEISISFIEYEGRPAEMGIVRDISERKQAAAELEKSNYKFKELFNNISSCVAVYEALNNGENFIIKDFNQAAEKTEGIRKDELLGKLVTDVFPGVVEMGLFTVFQRVWQTGKPEYYPISFYKDQRISGWRENYVYRLPSGEIVAAYEDITERKQAEEALRTSEENFRSSIEESPLGIRIISAKDATLYVNRALLDMWGYNTLEELQATSPQERYTPEEYLVYKEKVAKRQRGEFIPANYEASIKRKNGEVRYLSVSRKEVLWNGSPQFQMIYQDITERKQAEEKIKESEELLKEAQSLGKIASYEIDSVTWDIIWSDEMYELFERDKNLPPPTTKEIPGYFSPEEYAKFAGLRRIAVEEGKEAQGDVTARLPSGKTPVFHISVRPVKDDKGQLVKTFGTIQDVTERKQAEEKLRESEEFSTSLLQNSPNPINVINPDLSIKYINPSLEKLTGFSFAEIVGKKPPYPWRPGGKQEDYTPIFDDSLKMGTTVRERLFYKKNGEPIWVELGVTAVKDSGILRYYISNWTDITERKQAEEELKFRSQLLDAATDSILVLNDKNDIVYFNEAVCRSRGYDREEMNGKKLLDIIAPEYISLISSQVNKELGEKGEATFESIELCKDNSITPVEIHSRIIELGGQKYIVNISRDITQRKQADNELKQSYEKLQKTLDGIIAAMSATIEIRDPYTAGHQRQTAQLVRAIAQEIGLSAEQINGVYTAGLIHDIGKVGIPADILSKPGELSEVEFSLIKAHSQIGYDVLKNIDFPYPVARWILQHHERLNGSGYPAGLSGDKISLEAKILAVADVVDAMASHRPYRAALGIEAALDEITQQKDILYYGAAVDACVRLFKEKGYKLE